MFLMMSLVYKNPLLALKVSRNWIKSHHKAYEIIHKNDSVAYVSWNNYTGTYKLGGLGISLEFQERKESRPWWAKLFTKRDADEAGRKSAEQIEAQWQPDEGKKNNRGKKPRSLDFIGIDYYCRWNLPGSFTDADNWEIYPEGFYKVIKNYYNWFKVPVLVAENGMATRNLEPRSDGWTREAFMVQHVKQMQRAIKDGIPVIGYIHWSITDNYEWGTFDQRFGIYTVDCKNENFERIPTPAVEVYRNIVENNGVTPELERAYPDPRLKMGEILKNK
ncbi:family 1 glycosylhydrolase [Candidatus Riflebacteria bacterium]